MTRTDTEINFSHLKVKRLQSTVKLQADRALKFREEIEVYGATVHIRAKLYIFTEYQKGDQSLSLQCTCKLYKATVKLRATL